MPMITQKKGAQLRSSTQQPALQLASHNLVARVMVPTTCTRCQNISPTRMVGAINWHGVRESMQNSGVCRAAAAAEASPPISSSSSYVDDSRAFAVAMAKIADDTKATDLTVLHVEPLVSWCSYMVVCTVMSRPQLLAVLGRMEDAAQAEWDRTKQNSAGSSQWEVLDFGDVVVHVFTSEQREHYDLDSFYAAAEEVPLPFVEDWASSNLSEAFNKQSGSSTGSSGPVWSKNL